MKFKKSIEAKDGQLYAVMLDGGNLKTVTYDSEMDRFSIYGTGKAVQATDIVGFAEIELVKHKPKFKPMTWAKMHCAPDGRIHPLVLVLSCSLDECQILYNNLVCNVGVDEVHKLNPLDRVAFAEKMLSSHLKGTIHVQTYKD